MLLTCSLLARYLLISSTCLLFTHSYWHHSLARHLHLPFPRWYFPSLFPNYSINYLDSLSGNTLSGTLLVAGTHFIRITTYQDILSGNPPTTTSTYHFSYILSCSTPLTTPYLSFFLILISISSLSTTYSSFFLILISILKKPTLFGLVTSHYSLLLLTTSRYFSLLLVTSHDPLKKTSLSRLVLLVIYFFNLTIQYSSVTSTSLYIPFIS